MNHYFDYAMIIKKMFFFISLGRSLWKYLLTWSYIVRYTTNLSKKFPKGILPGKNMCNLKNFLPQEFQWSLTWFTSLKSSFRQFLSSFPFINKTLWLNKLKTRIAMNAKILVSVICVEAIIYLSSSNLHDCTFNLYIFEIE